MHTVVRTKGEWKRGVNEIVQRFAISFFGGGVFGDTNEFRAPKEQSEEYAYEAVWSRKEVNTGCDRLDSELHASWEMSRRALLVERAYERSGTPWMVPIAVNDIRPA